MEPRPRLRGWRDRLSPRWAPDAIRRFRDLELPVDEALTAIEMATLLDPAEPEVRAATQAAREILTRLREFDCWSQADLLIKALDDLDHLVRP